MDDETEFALAIARRRRRRRRQRIAAMVVLAGMVLGFSGLFVFDRAEPAGGPPAEQDP
jgi:hypothetical protein